MQTNQKLKTVWLYRLKRIDKHLHRQQPLTQTYGHTVIRVTILMPMMTPNTMNSSRSLWINSRNVMLPYSKSIKLYRKQ